MTKVELEIANEALKERVQGLEDELDSLNEAYIDLEVQLADTINSVGDYYISDVNNFICRMQFDGLYTPEIAKFIEDYMRYHNDLEFG